MQSGRYIWWKGKGETINRVNPVYKVIILLNYVNVNGFRT